MKTVGRFVDAIVTLAGELRVTLSISKDDKERCISLLNEMSKDKLMNIEIKPFRQKRSLDANAMLWACLGDMSRKLSVDSWELYKQELQKYGKFDYAIIRRKAVGSFMKEWRTAREIGEIEIHGEKAVQLQCFYGSSTYDSKEFSDLLNGVIADMKDLGLEPPPSREIERSLKAWEKQQKEVSAT